VAREPLRLRRLRAEEASERSFFVGKGMKNTPHLRRFLLRKRAARMAAVARDLHLLFLLLRSVGCNTCRWLADRFWRNGRNRRNQTVLFLLMLAFRANDSVSSVTGP
jgi:hypothetical protein